jgi:hypothetical protein
MDKERFLNNLKQLIASLNKAEIDIAKKHLSAYETNYTSKQHKRLQLFQLIAYKGITNYDSIVKKVSPSTNQASFDRLIKRTIDKIQESLILDINLKRKDSYSDIFKYRLGVRKQIMKSQVLIEKSLINLAKKNLSAAIKKAKLYELYDELIEALYVKQRISKNLNDSSLFIKLNNEVEFFENCRKKLILARNIHQSFLVASNTSAKSKVDLEVLKRDIDKIDEYYQETYSSNIKSYYYLLLIEYYYLQDKFFLEIETSHEFLSLLRKNKAVFSKYRIAIIYTSMSNTVYTMCDFMATYEYSKQSIEWTKSNPSLNHITALQQQIKSLFFLTKYEESIEAIRSLENHPLIGKMPFYKTKVAYFKAVNLFALGEYRFAGEELYDLREIEKDKEGWNLWVRMLRILNSIEQGRLDIVEYDIESQRKYVQRIDKMNPVRKRVKGVMSILLDLDRNGFDFEEVARRKEHELELLQSDDPNYGWDPKSPEMILFHDWFEAKRRKTAYEPDFSIYRIKWEEKERKRKSA